MSLQNLPPLRLYAYQASDPIPRSLLHPRWWLKGPVIHSTSWVPAYPLPENEEREQQEEEEEEEEEG
jgi:hypothetical protein